MSKFKPSKSFASTSSETGMIPRSLLHLVLTHPQIFLGQPTASSSVSLPSFATPGFNRNKQTSKTQSPFPKGTEHVTALPSISHVVPPPPRKKRSSGEFRNDSPLPGPVKRPRVNTLSPSIGDDGFSSTSPLGMDPPDISMPLSPVSNGESRTASREPDSSASTLGSRFPPNRVVHAQYNHSSLTDIETTTSSRQREIRAFRDVRNQVVACQDARIDGRLDDLERHLDELQ